MKRRGKIIATISTLCLALVMLTASVLAATSVSFNIGGSVSYIIEDVYVEFEARVYSSSKHFASDEELATASETLASSNFTALNAKTKLNDSEDYTFNKEQIKNTSNPSVWSESNEDYFDYYSSVTGGEHTSLDIDLAYSTTTQKLTYFVVIEVTNLSSETVYAYVNTEGENALAFPENSWTYSLGDYQTLTSSDNTKYFVFAFGLKDMTLGIENSDFNFPIVVTLDSDNLPQVTPLIELNSSVLDNTESRQLATTIENSLRKSLLFQTNEITGIFISGIDFEIPTNAISQLSDDENIELNFSVLLTNVPEDLAPVDTLSMYQLMTSLEGVTQEEFLQLVSTELLMSSKPVVKTQTADLINETTLNISYEGTYETYTLSISKSALTENKFSFVVGDYLCQTMANLQSMGINVELYNLWSPNGIYYIDNLLQTKNSRIDIGSSFTSYGQLELIPNSKTSIYAFSITPIDIPNDVLSMNLTLTSVVNFAYAIMTGMRDVSTTSLLEIVYQSVDIITDEKLSCTTANFKIPSPGESYTIFILKGETMGFSAAGSTIPVTITANFGGELELVKYSLSADGSYYIVDGPTYEGKSASKIEIPATYNGLPVKEIKDSAFFDKGVKATEIVLPQGLERIGENAFQYCHSLSKINLPSSLLHISSGVFSNTSVYNIVIENPLITLEWDSFYWDYSGALTIYTKATEATAERGDEYWKAGRDPATVYYYSEEEPTVEGNYWHYVNDVATPWN